MSRPKTNWHAKIPEAYRIKPERDLIPDVRDGLNRLDRIILYELYKAEQERPGRNVPSATLYGRVVEHIDIDVKTFEAVLARLVRK